MSFLLRKKAHEAVPENLAEVQKAFDREVAGKETKTPQAESHGKSAKDSAASSAGVGFVAAAQASDEVYLAEQKVPLVAGTL